MLPTRRFIPALAAAILTAVLAAAPALANPVTVNLRVEGSTRTLFEGPVTTEAISELSTEGTEGHSYPCDVAHNGSNAGEVPAAGNPTTALYDAAKEAGLAFNAKWFSADNDFFITQVGGDVEGGPRTTKRGATR